MIKCKNCDIKMKMIFNKGENMIKERNTKQKEILVKYLKENSDKHLCIQEIHSNLKEDIGMTTIYRIINSLIKKGLVKKIPLDNKQGYCYRYNDQNESCNNHYHLICENCNKLFHFESKQVNKLSIEIKNKENFDIDSNRIVFFGKCKECKLGENND